MSQIKREQPHIVQAHNVIGMLVREQRGVDNTKLLAQKLRPQVGRRIDQQVSFGKPDDETQGGQPQSPSHNERLHVSRRASQRQSNTELTTLLSSATHRNSPRVS